MRDLGNTVVVVEHDPDILRAADRLIDMGPGSGAEGGRIVASGTVDEIMTHEGSITGDYLSGRRRMPRRPSGSDLEPTGRQLRIRGAREHNLNSLDVNLPVDRLTVISGVSGSGKSSLVNDVIWRSFRQHSGHAIEGEVLVDEVGGFDVIDEIVLVDQSPIGRTPRGNPATYTKLFDFVRKLFAATEGARKAGLDASSFSFNVEGGRCPECSGAGAIQVEMQFLSDVTLPCEGCSGKRFSRRGSRRALPWQEHPRSTRTDDSRSGRVLRFAVDAARASRVLERIGPRLSPPWAADQYSVRGGSSASQARGPSDEREARAIAVPSR